MILRNMKKGSIGGALAAYAFFNPQYFGGFYKSDDDQKEGAVLGLPSQLFDHPLFLSMQAYASYSKYIDAETAGKSLKQSPLLATATGLSEHIPLADQLQQISTAMGSTDKLNTFLSNEAKGQIDPAILQQVAKWTDNSDARYPEKGEGLPTQLWQTVETGLPVLRENVDDVKPYKAKKYSSYAGDN